MSSNKNDEPEIEEGELSEEGELDLSTEQKS